MSPYIPQERRRAIAEGIPPDNPGELNYKICELIGNYILAQGLSYQTLNEVMGILACVSQELYHKIIRPYEDKKEAANGRVWPDFGNDGNAR